jgi:hypothetical protein
MSVRGFKLINGEEVIGDVDSPIIDNKYHVKNPYCVVPQQMTDRVILSLVPWTMSGGEKATIELERHAVAGHFKVLDSVEREYITQTTGIQLIKG